MESAYKWTITLFWLKMDQGPLAWSAPEFRWASTLARDQFALPDNGVMCEWEFSDQEPFIF